MILKLGFFRCSDANGRLRSRSRSALTVVIRRHAWLAAIVLAAFPLATATASMPVGLRVVLVSPDPHDQALNRAFLTILMEYDAFYQAEEQAFPPNVTQCANLSDGLQACVRSAIKPSPNDQENPPVVIVAASGPDNKFRWQCFGVGKRAYVAAKQDVLLDLQRAMFNSPQERFSWRQQAVNCIMAAASEAEGRVRVTRE